MMVYNSIDLTYLGNKFFIIANYFFTNSNFFLHVAKNKTAALSSYGFPLFPNNPFLIYLIAVLLHLLKRYILHILCITISTLLLACTCISTRLLCTSTLLLLCIINILACCCPCIVQFCCC